MIPPLRKWLHRPCGRSGAGDVQSGSTCLGRAGQTSERAGHDWHGVRLSQSHRLLRSGSVTDRQHSTITFPHFTSPPSFSKTVPLSALWFHCVLRKTINNLESSGIYYLLAKKNDYRIWAKIAGSVWEICSHKHFTLVFQDFPSLKIKPQVKSCLNFRHHVTLWF